MTAHLDSLHDFTNHRCDRRELRHRSCDRSISAKGHTVYGSSFNFQADKLQAMAADAGVTIELAELDVADGDSVRQGFDDIMNEPDVSTPVNNAGVGGNGVVEETSPKEFLDVMNVDLAGAVRCSQAVLRRCAAGLGLHHQHHLGCWLLSYCSSPYVASKWASKV